MERFDLARLYKAYYTASTNPELLETPPAQYVMISGKGDPAEKAYADKIQALYATAYSIKFIYKERDRDFTVAKLEGLWDYDEQQHPGLSITDAPAKIPRSEWAYKMMIRMPAYVTEEKVKAAMQNVVSRKQLQFAKEIQLYKITESKSVQMMHTGPFETEPETLLEIQAFMLTNGLQKNGPHHKISLTDLNKTSPEKRKTILREPVK